MLSRIAGRCLPALTIGAAIFARSGYAHAQTPCADLDLPNPIYGAGGSAITATLGKVATALANLDDPITVLWADPGACTGFGYFTNNDIDGTLKYWDAAGVQQTCAPAAVQPVDFAHMGNQADFCPGIAQPTGIGDFPGPVQTIQLITAAASSETSISAEALYYIYGFGAEQAGVAPWTTEAALFGRNSTSFVHLFLAASIGVPSTAFKIPATPANPTYPNVGTTQNDVINGINYFAATDPDATLGYVSGSAADQNRTKVKTLAYQHTGQNCGYWPDSNEDALDRANVRNGQYYLWTPGHFFARVDSNGDIEDPKVRDFIGWFTLEAEPPAGLDVTKIVSGSGDIPQCAMRVTRDGTVGAISSFAPKTPCNCYFESIATKQTPASCTACEDDGGCGGDTPKCHFGFCEAY